MAVESKLIEQTGKDFDKNETLKAKGIAICLLLFHHLFFNKARVENGGITLVLLDSVETLNRIGTYARICVWIFAFLSAYGLSVQYRKKQPESSEARCRFVGHYWLSLMKPYWFIFIVELILSFFIFRHPAELYKGSFVNGFLAFMGLADLFGTPMPSNAWWYMCFAQIVVLMVPILYETVKRFGILVLPMSFVLIQFLGTGIQSSYGGVYLNYLFAVVMGIWFAQKDVMKRLSFRWKHCVPALAEAALICLGICAAIMINGQYSGDDKWRYTKLFMTAGAILIVLFSFRVLTHPVVAGPLRFLGKHSGNIFLIHSFGYNFFLKQIYFSHNVFITFLTLLLSSLLVSMALEAIKSLMRKSRVLRRLV